MIMSKVNELKIDFKKKVYGKLAAVISEMEDLDCE